MHIQKIDPCLDPLWRSFVDSRESSVFHSPEWIRSVSETYGFAVEAHLLLDDQDRPVAGFPVCSVADMRGKRLIVFPFSDYYDPLVTDQSQWEMLLGPLLKQGVPIRFRCLHNELPVQDPRFDLVNRAKWHGTQVAPSLDELWQHIAPECRRAIQKAPARGIDRPSCSGARNDAAVFRHASEHS